MELLTCDFCGNQCEKNKVKFIPIDQKKVKVKCFQCTKPNNEAVKLKKSQNYSYFSCRRCDYDFRLDLSTKMILKCPYCGKKDQVIKKEFGKLF